MTVSTKVAPPAALCVRLEALAHCEDADPLAALPWVIQVLEGDTPLVEIGLVQAGVAGADLAPMAEDLFGPHAAREVAQASGWTMVKAGDITVAQAQILTPRPNADALLAYGLIRAMNSLRARSICFTWSALGSYSVADILGAVTTTEGGRITAQHVRAKHAVVLSLVMGPHRGLHLTSP